MLKGIAIMVATALFVMLCAWVANTDAGSACEVALLNGTSVGCTHEAH